jgi:hypothetical protein
VVISHLERESTVQVRYLEELENMEQSRLKESWDTWPQCLGRIWPQEVVVERERV